MVLEYLSAASAFWSKYGSVFSGAFSMVAVIAALVGARVWANRFRLIFQHSNDAMNFAFYSDLDRAYADILRLAIDKPYLRAPARIETDREALAADYEPYPSAESDLQTERNLQYDAYAYMVWNFLETIRDRCAENEALRATWAPVIGAENAIHRGWFLVQIRREEMMAREAGRKQGLYLPADKFCAGFQEFVLNHRWHQTNGTYSSWAYDTRMDEPAKVRKTLVFD